MKSFAVFLLAVLAIGSGAAQTGKKVFISADMEGIIGISLAGEGVMRFRRYPPRRDDGKAARAELKLTLQPRSIYTLQGEARWKWQHAVSPTKTLRYSITFRTRRS